MDIAEKFELGAINHTYRRIDSEYIVDIFLGYNDDGQMSMVLTEMGKETPVKSTQLISVSLKRREDGKLALAFDLLDKAYKSMFLVFCKDLITYCEKAGPEMAISSAIIRWKYWKELFGREKSDRLDLSEIQGLIGELIVLREYCLERYSEKEAISSWMGPLLGHKDFEINETWFEVKSISEAANQIIVNSLEQLDSDVLGHLLVVRLEKTSSVNSFATNLNKEVFKILNLIEDPECMELFQTRLNNTGYTYDKEYESYNFVHKGTEMYRVDEAFPRLKRRDVVSSIGNAKYTVLLNGITAFKE